MNLSNLNITIIGAGKIAYSLAGALQDNGLFISSVISRNIFSAQKLADEYGIKSYSDKIETLDISSNIIILSVSDDQIKYAAENIARLKLDFSKVIVVHLSGALNSTILNCLEKKRCMTASFHILQTFPSKSRVSIANNYAAIETNSAKAKKILYALAELLKLIPFSFQAESKINYHIACVAASNFLAGNMFFAQRSLQLAGVRIDSAELTAPLINATLKNIKEKGAVKALSGPVERNDIATVANHIKALKKKYK